jgi:hypothetical protein
MDRNLNSRNGCMHNVHFLLSVAKLPSLVENGQSHKTFLVKIHLFFFVLVIMQLIYVYRIT